jgi:hypothetical protein
MTTAVAARATNTGIGRLNLLKFEGDTDNDGKIDLPTMMGTRSFSIWNSLNGTLVYDSGSTLETFAAANDPETFNTNSGSLSNTDTRSDDKGPEPEAIAYGSIAGRSYAFVGTERQNGIYAFDITDLSKVKVVGYFNTISSTEDSGAAYISPESIKFIPAAANPSGKNLIVVGYEGTGSNGSVGVFEFVPAESSTPTTPTITTQPTASSITSGQTLASSTLSGGNASVAGSFAFTTPSTVPAVGTTTHSVTFTPTDSGNYTTATTSVSVTVEKATPTITTQPTASSITSGQTLASSTLSGGNASVAGSFAFTTPSTVPAVGTTTHSVTFTPTDSGNYNTLTANVSITVNDASPTPEPTLSQRSLSTATTREEVKAIVSSKIQEALAQDPVKVKTASQIAGILGVSKSTLSKIAKLSPRLMTEGGKINIAKLEKLISNNPKAAALLTGNAKIQGGSKKSSGKK